MTSDLIIEMARERREAFTNLSKHLKTIKKTASKLDGESQVYLFGSVAEKMHNYSSDIDILIVTNLSPATIHAELWKAALGNPSKFTFITNRAPSFSGEGRS